MKVAVLLSGGVDSTVSAMLLREQGYEVMGLTMVNWDESVGQKAANAAKILGIEHKIVDLRKDFQARVVDYFCQAYENAKTPNPCVECNKYIKFGALLDIALEENCDMVATGHYARIEYSKEKKRYLLRKGKDKKKDQSYFLYGLKQEQLAKIIFPLGNYSKDEVRELARQRNMKVAESGESQEICFIAGDYRDFIQDRIKYQGGEFHDLQGHLMGKHRGMPFYTIGQRKGLGVNGGRPLYVIDMDLDKNTIFLGNNEDLFADSLLVDDINLVSISELNETMQVQAKIRYAAKPADAVIRREDQTVRVNFSEAQRAITRGQSVVWYQGEYVVGGGIII